MPISQIAFVRTTVALMLAGLVALLVIVATSLWLVGRTQTFSSQTTGTRQLRSALVDLRSLLQDAETGQRGFLLTHNASYLVPYTNARENLADGMRRLAEKATINPDVQSDLPVLEATIRDKFAELSQTVDLAEAGQFDDALLVVKTDRGKVLMDRARELLGRMVADVEDDIAESVEEQSRSVTYLRWVTLFSVLAVAVVIGGCAWAVLTYTRQLIAAEKEVRGLNVSLEERVQERTAELVRVNDEVQRFAYIVTHDLRAPLVNVMGFTSELEESLAALQTYLAKVVIAPGDDAAAQAQRAVTEDVPEAISFIRLSTKKMDALINAILKLSREGRRALKPERVDLKALIEGAAANIHHQVTQAGGTIDVEGKASVISDRMGLEQIFGNLLDNAYKYRSPDRALKLKVRATEERGERVIVEVQDNGRGIAPQDHERVFELFRRSGTQDQPGEGIGLAHVRTLTRSLGADITMRSEFGQGTTFRVELPRKLRSVRSSET